MIGMELASLRSFREVCRQASISGAAHAIVALAAYRRERPGVRVAFAEEVTPRLLPALCEGELDVAAESFLPALRAAAAEVEQAA
ncbi:hypothetical protein ACGFX4_04050 [Kitasatospora sp. NPDC048365]|uniref:hypothetical protein n=1 Tax=Kitasatospora sp. NPDC048365 TaxID=3364050 RepID=UPI00371DA725